MIAVRGLMKSIGRQEILRGIDLTVAKGETLVIIGRSGGGKSVLLKHLIGLMQPDAGEIWVDGQNIIGLNERKLAAIRRKVSIPRFTTTTSSTISSPRLRPMPPAPMMR